MDVYQTSRLLEKQARVLESYAFSIFCYFFILKPMNESMTNTCKEVSKSLAGSSKFLL